MTRQPVCACPIGLGELLDYWLGDLDEAADERIDQHIVECGACSKALGDALELAAGLRAAFAHGDVHAFVSDAFVKRLASSGARLREYRVPLNGSVNCTVAPGDDFLISRLEAPLQDVRRLDVASYVDDRPQQVFHDVPFGADRGELVIAPKIAYIRAMPAHRYRLRLIAVDTAGDRTLGDYTFLHTPHAELA